MALPVYSLVLLAVTLIISLAAFPYMNRVLRRRYDPPVTGLEVLYPEGLGVCGVKLEEEPDAVKVKFE
jgi:hypothetical protein